MDRRTFIGSVANVLLALPIGTLAQQRGKVWRIGILMPASANTNTHYYRAFVEGLQERGLIEGKNIALEWRFADGDNERLQALAQELVNFKVDVIVANSTPGVRAVRQATSTIPIVMVVVGDPVASGFATSLSRPGGNSTGLSISAADVSAKQLELLRTLSPEWSRIAVLTNSANPFHVLVLKEVQSGAARMGVRLLHFEARSPVEIDAAFAAMMRERAQAVIVAPDPLFRQQGSQLAELAERHRLPSMLATKELVEAGGLMSYGQDYVEHYRRAATYVDKILKGANPADLPIELPTKFELVINMRTAKALGLTIPQSVLLRADDVIQ
jgi:putative ABC transport system substrate-binding protein